jgi:hypothetical protein
MTNNDDEFGRAGSGNIAFGWWDATHPWEVSMRRMGTRLPGSNTIFHFVALLIHHWRRAIAIAILSLYYYYYYSTTKFLIPLTRFE